MFNPIKPGKPAGFHYGFVILLMGTLAVTGVLGLARFGYGMIIPEMRQDLGLSHEQIGYIASADTFGYFISALVAGLLAARFGPRVIVTIGLLWTGLAMISTGLVQTPYTAALARFLTGVGSAGGNIAIMGLASAWFAPSRRGMAAGVLVGGSGIAIALTGWMVPQVNSMFLEAGWRYNWFILGAVNILLGVAAWLVLRNSPLEKNLLPLGETLPVTVREDRPGANRVVIKDLIKIPGVFHLAALYFCFGISYIITATFFIVYLIDEVRFTQELAGSIWATAGILSIGSSVFWGILSDKIGRKPVLVSLFSIQALAYFLLVLKFSSPLLLWLAAILYGLTAWGIPSLAASCCGDISDAKRASAVLGLITFVFGFGQMLGPVSAGYIKELTSSFTWAFLFAAILAALGALFSNGIVIPARREH